jgi:hypothetical protein
VINNSQFKILCKLCNNILNFEGSNIFSVSNPWLHIIRAHPIVFNRYSDIFIKVNAYKSYYNIVKKKITWYLLWCRQVIKALKSDGSSWFTKDLVYAKTDFLFISHLLNPSQFKVPEDFYFGSIPQIIELQNRSVIIAFISHFNGHKSLFNKLFVKSKISKVYFSETLSLSKEILIRKSLKNESKKLSRLANNEVDPLFKKVILKASFENNSYDTHQTLRLYYQVSELVKKTQPAAIVLPFEGHAYERICFAAARKIIPGIKCISYQHTGVFANSNAIYNVLLEQYNPDIILTSGVQGLKKLRESNKLNLIPIEVLGSIRGALDVTNKKVSTKTIYCNSCLVIPEGFESECSILFNFSINCARLLPEINFIWRLHPSIKWENLSMLNFEWNDLPKNIIISTDSIDDDILKCNWALYRGTTAIFKSISYGLRPIYLSIPGEISIDPLEDILGWKIAVTNPLEFKKISQLDINSKFKNKTNFIHSSLNLCQQQFAQIDTDILINTIK